MVTMELDSITFRLKESHDFGWLKRYGRAFWCVDETGSGCICIGMEQADKKYFCKIAGVDTIEADVTAQESVQILKDAVLLYDKLKHPNLVRIIEAYEYDELYVAVFEWVDGECLFDHWNFETYKKNPLLKSPMERFRELSAGKKLVVVDALFSFLQNVNKNGYVAVDFYDGSILYDFATDRVTLCDIDLFRKTPVVNDRGMEWYGTKRLKAPEEYIQGSIIDERTNIFTLGALIFDFFGTYSADEIKQRYIQNRFMPCAPLNWQLNENSYKIAEKAVSASKQERYRTFEDFSNDWHKAVAPVIC